jgi:endonuclease G, mitochondrial
MSAERSGYDAAFLGEDLALPGRMSADGAPELVRVDYVHFTVLLDRQRRLARVTGANVDGASLLDLPRADDWSLDSRIPASWQAGPELYAGNDLDRGHLVRRRDPVWGERSVAEQANEDTFRYTNAAPQASGFNQSAQLWLGLEDHVLEYAEANRSRISVFTAPVLRDTDPGYRGVRIPLGFWKAVAWSSGDALAAIGFLLDQTPQLNADELERRMLRAAEADQPPPLGPFRTFQVSIAELGRIAELDLGALAAADRFPRGALPPRRISLSSFDDIAL